jgi:flagellar basal-body rod protein FlgG
LYAAASGIASMEERHAIIANNIANASTTGFRRQEPVQKGFYAMFSDTLRRPAVFNQYKTPGGGAALSETFTDMRPGPITTTDNPLNIALSGPGFLSVDTPDGRAFTRTGNFVIDADGQLATPEGQKVLSAGGAPITVGEGVMSVTTDGTVLVNGLPVDQLEVTEFEDPHMLNREGESLFRADDAALARSAPAESTTVVHKALEAANVNLPQEMIAMTLGLRAYGANQKVVNAIDETVQRLIEQVAMPA